MNDDINTKRTELANQMAAAGAALLDFTGTAAALAAIPDTEPQQYVAAGTPENIAAILPATITPQRRQKHGERPSAADLEWDDTATSGDAPADLQQLKALALAATPGPWVNNRGLIEADDSGYSVGEVRAYFAEHDKSQAANAAYIAAANPAVVLDLIARLQRSEESVAQYQQSAHELAEELRSARIERAAAPAPTSDRAQLIDALRQVCNAALPVTNAAYNIGQSHEQWDNIKRSIDALDAARRNAFRLIALGAQGDARAAVSAATKPTDRELAIAQAVWAECCNGGHNPDEEPKEWAARMLKIDLPEIISKVPGAATKPTADLNADHDEFWKHVIAYCKGTGNEGQALVDYVNGWVQSLLATKPAAAPAVPEGAAVDANGTTYHNIAEIYHQAEECEALHMWLDEQGVPRADAEGKVFSPVGRVMGVAQDAARFRWLNADHDDAGVREQARSLAKRLGTSSYFAITRDIDAAMSSRCRAQGGVTNNTNSGNSAASTTGAAQTAEQVRDAALEEAAELVKGCDERATLRGIACAIRALKRPTPTHSSEAGDAK